MSHRFEVNGVSIGVTDDLLGDAVVSEFLSLAGTDAPPELRVELRPGYVTPPGAGTRVGENVVVGDD